MSTATVCLFPLSLRGEIAPGDDLAGKILDAAKHQRLELRDDDLLVVKHKIVSKAEGRLVRLSDVKPSRAAQSWARRSGGDARLIEVVLRESKAVVKKRLIGERGVLITETHHGFVCANSGVDISNVDGGRHALLLPKDPDASARRLRRDIERRTGAKVAVIISDSFGRPWREGLTEVAIGVAGMKPLLDYRGKRDPHGYKLHASAEAVADELACAGGLLCGKLEGVPVCVIRGFKHAKGRGDARELLRAKKNDMFR